MEVLLSKVTQQAMNHAIRCGITITGGFAIRQCSRLLKNVKENEKERNEIATLQQRLEAKIRIISPAIDMIELIAARGNTSLESAVTLTKQIRWDIQSLGVRLAKAAAGEEIHRRGSVKSATSTQNQHELRLIIGDMKHLLEKIEDAVPLINLAITTSGVSLSTTLPSAVSPSRLLQASTFLTAGDTRYAMRPGNPVQVGPIFTLSMYMLFSAHAYRPQDEGATRETTWKEVVHKARLKMLRVPLERIYDLPGYDGGGPMRSIDSIKNKEKTESPTSGVPSEGQAFEFAYQLLIVEDLEDDRVHTFEDDQPQPEPFDDVKLAGIREILPVHEVSKIFYADTGKILNIGADGEANNPILLLKRDVSAIPPRRMMDRQAMESTWYDENDEEDVVESIEISDETPGSDGDTPSNTFEEEDAEPVTSGPWSLPQNLDPEWIAFEVYTEAPDSDEEDDDDEQPSSVASAAPVRPRDTSRANSLEPSFSAALANLQINETNLDSPQPDPSTQLIRTETMHAPATLSSMPTAPTSFPILRTSLSLLELLIRLTSLQQFQQASHLAINDELLNFFLSEAGSTGAGGDAETRQRVRREARERVGFDPYDESPIKRRGEEYLEHYAEASQYEGTDAGAQDRQGARFTPQFSPRLAAGLGRFSHSPSPRSSPVPASKRTFAKPYPSSPGMSSPLARKSTLQSAPTQGDSRRTSGKPALGRRDRDSTLGTSPGSAQVGK